MRVHKLLLCVSCRNSKTSAVVVVHGGAWAIPKELAKASVDGVKVAACEGYSVLKRGGSALDAVEAAVRTMEDNTVFNAGTLCRIILMNIYETTTTPIYVHRRSQSLTILFINSVTFVHSALSPSAGGDATTFL